MVSAATLLPVALGAVASLAGVVALRRGHRSRKQAELTASAESKAIADLTAEDGRVSLSGRVEAAEDPVESVLADASGPVVKTEAARYNAGTSGDMDGDGVRETNEGAGSYDYRQEAVQASAFDIDDSTGQIHVDVDGTTDAVVEPTAHVDVENGAPEEVIGLADELGDDLIIGSQTARIRQGVIEIGDDATVQGVPRQTGEGLVLGAGEVPVLVSDRSKSETEQAQAAGGVGQYVLGVVLLLVGVGVMALPFVV